MDIDDREEDLINSLRRALAIADKLSLRFVAIKIAEALDHLSNEKGNLPPRNGESSDSAE